MAEAKTHYPAYDVMALQDEWDSNTKEIVLKRLGPFPKAKFLKKDEEELIAKIAEHIIYDNRADILQWIVHHSDQKLYSTIGEGDRKPETPSERDLIRQGLKAIYKLAKTKHNKNFLEISTKEQFEIMAALQLGKAEQLPEWSKIPQKELFKKLAELIVSAYYSHPTIWSEIGYGGPAYPRGYYRVEFGLTDPWEPKLESANTAGFGEESEEVGK